MTPAIGSEVWLERRKWPDSPHYGVAGTVLGQDRHGVWVGAPMGSMIVNPDGSTRQGRFPAVWCLPNEEWFFVHFLLGHPDLMVYVDICTPPVWSDRGARMIDLDFDVVVWNSTKNGLVELVDEDEFEQHRVTLGYPEELVAATRNAAADVFARTRAGVAPFTFETAQPWLDVLLQ